MWWYELWELIQQRHSLELDWDGQHHIWNLVNWSDQAQCFQDIKNMIMFLPLKEILTFMKKVRKEQPAKEYPHECLTSEDIQSLDLEPLITIGAHTHTHPSLKAITAEEVKFEMLDSKQLLEKILGHPVNHFAYPYGSSDAAGPREYNIARLCGFKTSVTALCHKFDPQQQQNLPRYALSERDTPRILHTRLSGWNAFWKQQL